MKTAKKSTSKLNRTGMTDAGKAEWRAAKSAQLDGRVAALKKLNEKPAAPKPAPKAAHPAPDATTADVTPPPAEPAAPTPAPEAPAATQPTEAPHQPPTTPKPRRERKPREGKMGCLSAAAQVLAASPTPMTAKAMIDAMAAQGLWTSPGGKTPAATLYAAISREIKDKRDQARFRKTERGLFAAKG